MVSVDPQIIIINILVSAIFVDQTLSHAVRCQDPPYLQNLKNEVRQFYTITSDPDELTQQGPCSYTDGNNIGRPRLSVHTLESWHSEMSTCPWTLHIDEDVNGFRYPCRIATAKLVIDSSTEDVTTTHRHRSTTCLISPGVRHPHADNKLCRRLLQTVPVVSRTECRNGVNDYTIQNITINVGFTCTFVQ